MAAKLWQTRSFGWARPFSLLMLAAALTLGGCHAFSSVSPKQRRSLAGLRYPAHKAHSKNLDIVVVRHGDDIQLVNRTAQPYKNVQLWINRQYVRRVKDIGIGTDNHFDLTSFVNHYQESFPVGTLLAPEKAADLVLAEIYNPRTGQRHRLFIQNPMAIDQGARSRGQREQLNHRRYTGF